MQAQSPIALDARRGVVSQVNRAAGGLGHAQAHPAGQLPVKRGANVADCRLQIRDHGVKARTQAETAIQIAPIEHVKAAPVGIQQARPGRVAVQSLQQQPALGRRDPGEQTVLEAVKHPPRAGRAQHIGQWRPAGGRGGRGDASEGMKRGHGGTNGVMGADADCTDEALILTCPDLAGD